MATHSSILAWEISWTEEPGGLWSIDSQRDTTEHRHQLWNNKLLSETESIIQACNVPLVVGRELELRGQLQPLRLHLKDATWKAACSHLLTGLLWCSSLSLLCTQVTAFAWALALTRKTQAGFTLILHRLEMICMSGNANNGCQQERNATAEGWKKKGCVHHPRLQWSTLLTMNAALLLKN